jgi:hypothetical protein
LAQRVKRIQIQRKRTAEVGIIFFVEEGLEEKERVKLVRG